MSGSNNNMKNGIEVIAEERQRQIDVEGWTPEHDAQHRDGHLALAAACYATPILLYKKHEFANSLEFSDPWPWASAWDKRPHNGNVIQDNSSFNVNLEGRLRQLAKAGALIAAEIDRLQGRS
jgi:hypothetical protein